MLGVEKEILKQRAVFDANLIGTNWTKVKTDWKVEGGFLATEPGDSGQVFSWNSVRTNPSP